MEVEETTKTEEVKAEEQVLCDLQVNDEQANGTNGGSNLMNFTKVMLKSSE